MFSIVRARFLDFYGESSMLSFKPSILPGAVTKNYGKCLNVQPPPWVNECLLIVTIWEHATVYLGQYIYIDQL